MRRLIAFPCAGETLAATLDDAPGKTGLLIVTGGNEIRAGAHRGMALLAARLAGEGMPVFRYDRRGIGDSTGTNGGFAQGKADLLAAAACFRAEQPQLDRIVGFGNCDAATTLAWWGRDAGLDAVVLANPWTVEPVDDLPPPAAIRAHYAARLRDPATWVRIARKGISISRLFHGLRRISAKGPRQELTRHTLDAITSWGDAAIVVLASGDATAIAYADVARRRGLTPRTITIDSASHSFARPEDARQLEHAIRTVLRG